MSKGTRITFEERQKIEKLLKEGLSGRAISLSIGRSHHAVKNDITLNGGRSTYNAERAQKSSIRRKETRLKKIETLLTPKQEAIIFQGIQEKWPINQIRKAAGISWYKMQKILSKMGYDGPTDNFFDFMERLSAIEQQIEIILNLLETKK